jgi:hypothetical protein
MATFTRAVRSVARLVNDERVWVSTLRIRDESLVK